MKLRLPGSLLALLLIAAPVSAEHSFEVLGSFLEPETARKEGSRFVAETGLEILLYETPVGERLQYRLLTSIPQDPVYVDQLEQRLAQAGLADTWTLRLPDELPFMETVFAELELVDVNTVAFAAPQGNYIVAGSFREPGRADALVERLSLLNPVSIVRVDVSGASYQRVLVGPVAADEEASVIARLVAQGIEGAWVLRSSEEVVPYVQENQDITPELRGLRMPGKPATPKAPTPVREYEGDYNPAKLKKKSTPFPTPGATSKSSSGEPGRWRTDIAPEFRIFNDPGLNDLDEFYPSVSIQTEYYKTWNGGSDIFAFVPFYRWDGQDEERTHFDIRELTWVHVSDDWELRTGIRKVFWGVTESQHLVDIVNQTDNVENPDGEEKLGQPMINLSLIRDWGVLDFYVLTGFRERNFPGEKGRPRLPLLVDDSEPVYESSAEQYRTDFAVRWTNYFGELEVGLSHFSGTSREPRFQADLRTDEPGIPGEAVLIPVYDVIDQTGFDAQYFVGDWAWKLEAITRSGQGDRFSAATFGFEKTFVGILGTRGDLGVVAEYLFDDRGEDAPVIGEDDVALGFRYTVNNPSDTTALLVWLYDVDSDEYLMTLEASSRIGASWKMILEASMFNGDPESELGFFQDEDFIKLEFIRYF